MAGKPSVSSKRAVIVLCIAAIVAYGLVLRFLHLFSADHHYYIISADSYFFDWQAHRILAGASVRMAFHGGLTYPLAYLAKAIGLVFHMSPEGALKVAGLVLPPMLAVLSIIVIYLAVSRIYDKRVGLFSAVVWAIFVWAVFAGDAGYLDRDGLSVLLIMIGALIFALSGDWHWTVHGLDLGCLTAALAILAIEALLFIEWVWLGPLILLAIVLAALATEILVLFYRRLFSDVQAEEDPVDLAFGLLKRSPGSLANALKTSNWRPVALITGLSVSVTVAGPGLGDLHSRASEIVRDTLASKSQAAEMQGLSLGDFISYGPLVVPLLIGLYISLKSSRRGDFLCLGWFVGLFLAGLFARRLFFYTLPASCIISGLGLAYLFQFGALRLSVADLGRSLYDPGSLLRYALAGAAVILLLLSIVFGTIQAYHIGSDHQISPDSEWQAALLYLKDNASQSAVIMSWWDYGYWILDVTERLPVVDNGDHTEEQDHDIAVAYTTTEASEVVRIMQKYGADCVIFSQVEYAILPDITYDALGQIYGDGQSIPQEMRDSIYSRSLSGDFQSSGDLQRIYPAPGAEAEVVILARG